MIFTVYEGVLTLQAYTYFDTYWRKDGWKLKTLVRTYLFPRSLLILNSYDSGRPSLVGPIPLHPHSVLSITRVLDFVHLGLISQVIYHYLVSNFGNDQELLYSTVPYDLHLIFVGMATILCQGYFLQRLTSLRRGSTCH